MNDQDVITAAVLTPPGAGGIAVIQLTGRDVPSLLHPFLTAGSHAGLDGLEPDTLRLARLCEGDEPIDDVLVVWRHDEAKRCVVDLNLHGGPWIVQRTLLLLKRAGARLVDAAPHARLGDKLHTTLAAETTAALLTTTTPLLARTIARSAALLPEKIQGLIARVKAGRLDEVRAELTRICHSAEIFARALAGFRVVLSGSPNSGKSTLANLLSGREAALVSPEPGTTRDWTEHPAAVEGIPFTFVDTAGLRTATDPIERLAMERGLAQRESADAILHLIDLSAPLQREDRILLTEPPDIAHSGRWIPIWNKADLPPDPSHEPYLADPRWKRLTLSASTGAGLDDLRSHLLKVMGMADPHTWEVVPFTARQRQAFGQALTAIEAQNARDAVVALHSILHD